MPSAGKHVKIMPRGEGMMVELGTRMPSGGEMDVKCGKICNRVARYGKTKIKQKKAHEDERDC